MSFLLEPEVLKNEELYEVLLGAVFGSCIAVNRTHIDA